MSTYGPNTLLVEQVLARARQLEETEAMALLDANRRLVVTNPRLSLALRDVVYAAFRSDREESIASAQRAGRGAVSVFAGSRRQAALGGIVGRICETLVVLELLPLDSRTVLLSAWRSAIDEQLGLGAPTPFGV